MELRRLEEQEHQKTRKLWEEVFSDDTRAFLDYYYFIKTKENEIWVIEEDGEIQSMLQLNPYQLEGLIIGIVGAVLPLALLYALYGRAVGYVMTKFQILKNIVEFLPVGDVYRYLLPIGLLLGVGIGFLGSFFTVRKHLKV